MDRGARPAAQPPSDNRANRGAGVDPEGGTPAGLVGRATELARLVAALTGHQPGAVIVTGPAGVGTTRLATEALARAAQRGRRWRRVPAWAPVREAREAVAGVAGGRRTILFVDDVRLLAGECAAVLAEAVLAERAALLVTLRAGEPMPDPVAAVWRAGRATRIDLGPLAGDEVDRLAAGWLGGPLTRAGSHRLRAIAGGNPLQVREVLAAARDAGMLTELDGLRHLTGTPVCPRLTDLLEAGLAGTAPDERAALELLALAEPVGLRLLHELVGEPVTESLERRGLIEVRADGRRQPVRLAHRFHRELLRAAMPATARLRYHRRLAGAVEAYGRRRPGDLVRWARWRLEVADPSGVDPRLMVAAAAEATTLRMDPATRERLARTAGQPGRDLPAGLLLAQVLAETGRPGPARELLAELASQARTDPQVAEVARVRAGSLAWGEGRVREALTVLDGAETRLADPAARTAVRLDRAAVLADAGQPAGAVRIAQRLDLPADPELAARAAAVFAAADLLSGRPERAVPPDRAGPDQAGPAPAGARLVQAYGYAGHLALARQYAHRLLAAAADRGDPYEHAWVLARLAAVEVAAGDLTAAQRYATEAYRLPDRTDAGGLTPALAAASLAPGLLAAVHRHDLATADRLAARLDAIYPEIATLGLVAFEADRARAWWRVQHGAHVAAHELLVDRAERWLRNGGVLPVVLFASDLARTGAEAAATQLVDRLPPPESWPLGEALVRFVRAVHARAGAELAAVASVFDRLGCRLYAAEAAAAAMPRRDRGAARAALLVAICGNPRTPLVAGVRGESCALTGREREVAALAAGGLPNQAIADRLTLSVRTVENHLNRAFAKLGIGRRTELAGLLEDRADAPASTVRR